MVEVVVEAVAIGDQRAELAVDHRPHLQVEIAEFLLGGGQRVVGRRELGIVERAVDEPGERGGDGAPRLHLGGDVIIVGGVRGHGAVVPTDGRDGPAAQAGHVVHAAGILHIRLSEVQHARALGRVEPLGGRDHTVDEGLTVVPAGQFGGGIEEDGLNDPPIDRCAAAEVGVAHIDQEGCSASDNGAGETGAAPVGPVIVARPAGLVYAGRAVPAGQPAVIGQREIVAGGDDVDLGADLGDSLAGEGIVVVVQAGVREPRHGAVHRMGRVRRQGADGDPVVARGGAGHLGRAAVVVAGGHDHGLVIRVGQGVDDHRAEPRAGVVRRSPTAVDDVGLAVRAVALNDAGLHDRLIAIHERLAAEVGTARVLVGDAGVEIPAGGNGRGPERCGGGNAVPHRCVVRLRRCSGGDDFRPTVRKTVPGSGPDQGLTHHGSVPVVLQNLLAVRAGGDVAAGGVGDERVDVGEAFGPVPDKAWLDVGDHGTGAQ